MNVLEFGEVRHERCRFARLTEAWVGGEPMSVPLCTWSLPEPAPPAIKRAWGGRVDPERDCALCLAYAELPGEPEGPA